MDVKVNFCAFFSAYNKQEFLAQHLKIQKRDSKNTINRLLPTQLSTLAENFSMTSDIIALLKHVGERERKGVDFSTQYFSRTLGRFIVAEELVKVCESLVFRSSGRGVVKRDRIRKSMWLDVKFKVRKNRSTLGYSIGFKSLSEMKN